MAVNMAQFESVLARLESVAARLEKGTAAASGSPSGESPGEDAPAIALAFDTFLQSQIPAVESCAKDLDVKDVTEATEVYVQSLRLLREMLVATGSCQKPKDTDWQKILSPILELGNKAQKACDSRSDFFQHRKASAESLNAFMLVTSPSPPGHVQSIMETFDFHANKVLQKKVEKETAWVRAFKASLKELKDWCAENCKMGIVWNVKGQAAADYFAAQPLGAAPSAAGAAPKASKGKGKGPPPPKGGFVGMPEEVKAKLKADTAPKAAPAGAGMSAVFNAIGGFDTGKLKKVTDVMKTKNQVKEGSQVIPAAKAAAPSKSAFSKRGPKGEAKTELQKDVNWMVENYDGERVVMEDATMKQLVVILNCRNTTITVPNKVKSICVDSCEKVNVLCQDVISAVELVNCDRCQMQALGKVVAVAIDKCDGVNVWLSKESVNAEITASKSSEMNVTIPDPDGKEEDGDLIEIAIPEQFVSRVVGKKLKTEVSGIYSG